MENKTADLLKLLDRGKEQYKGWSLETVYDFRLGKFKTMGRKSGGKRWYRLGTGDRMDMSLWESKWMIDSR